ncbi:MAG: RNA-binding protein [Rhodoferax sp.]|nr:RNA-binding protein [Rhodoferax sp.]
MKPFSLESSMLTMRGVFYPTGYLFVMLPKLEDAETLDRNLRASGYSGREVMLLTPEVILGQIRKTVRDDTNPLPSAGSESDTVREYEKFARQGHCAVMIHVPSEKDTPRIMETVRSVPFSYAQKYRPLIIEDMV